MYDVNLMTAPLISSLTPIWPNLIGPDKYLWSYEFNHHGSCAWRSTTQQGYFNDAIRAFDIVEGVKNTRKGGLNWVLHF